MKFRYWSWVDTLRMTSPRQVYVWWHFGNRRHAVREHYAVWQNWDRFARKEGYLK